MGNTREVIIFRYNQIITAIFYDPIMNNASSNNNFYLGREGKKWYCIIKYFESPLQRTKCTLYYNPER
jgi:hypothetical protein